MSDMGITGPGVIASVTADTTGSSAPAVTAVDPSDASFFSHAMEQNASRPEAPSMADQVLEQLHAFSDRAAERGEELERLIFRATETLNPLDMVQANRMMSDYYLENMMTAKMIGQSTQAVERLTNLS